MSTELTGCRELTSSFNFTQTERGITATRVFIYQPADTNGPKCSLPTIGDKFVNPLTMAGSVPLETPNLLCRTREHTLLNADKKTYQFVCTYTNEPCDIAQFIQEGDNPQPSDVANLPVTMEYSGEFVNVRPPTISDSMWYWKSIGDSELGRVLDPISFKVINLTLRVKRWLTDTNYDYFMGVSQETIGHVNDAPLPTRPFGSSTGKGMYLYESVSTDMYYNHEDKKIWQAELIFKYRNPDGGTEDGWQKILSRKGEWDIPVRRGSPAYPNIYPEADFSFLFVNQADA